MTYDEFIQNILNTRGRFNIPEGEYKERHHIIPKCIGGTNDKNNLIDLYAREHFIAHKLLAEENQNNYKLVCAWWNMCNIKNNNEIRYIPNEDEYEEARKAFGKWLSDTRQGENHPFYGKHHTEAALKKISARSAGKNNPMYGLQCYYKMTEDEIKTWKTNVGLFCQRRRVYFWVEGNKYFISGRAAARELNIPWSRVQRSAAKGITINGYTFIKLDKREIDPNTGEVIM